MSHEPELALHIFVSNTNEVNVNDYDSILSFILSRRIYI